MTKQHDTEVRDMFAIDVSWGKSELSSVTQNVEGSLVTSNLHRQLNTFSYYGVYCDGWVPEAQGVVAFTITMPMAAIIL